MTAYDGFEELSKQIGQVNRYLAAPLRQLSDGERRPIDRVNDAALIVFHVFAFEDFCRHYVADRFVGKAPRGYPRSDLLKNLRRAAGRRRQVQQIRKLLNAADQIIMIRDIYAHRLGRREGLNVSKRLTPTILRSYSFEADGQTGGVNARWWPTRFCSFSKCVAPLMELARWINRNLAVQN